MFKIFIALPSHVGLFNHFTIDSLIKLMLSLKDKNIDFKYRFLANSGIEDNRQTLVSLFMQTNCSHLLFVDSDMVFTPDDFFKLLDANVDIVGGVYVQKHFPTEWDLYDLKDKLDKETGLIETSAASMGFTLISRNCINKMITAYPQLQYIERGSSFPVYGLFMPGILQVSPVPGIPGHNEFWPEDWAFSKRWRDIGGKIYAHAGVKVGHVGNHIYQQGQTLL